MKEEERKRRKRVRKGRKGWGRRKEGMQTETYMYIQNNDGISRNKTAGRYCTTGPLPRVLYNRPIA